MTVKVYVCTNQTQLVCVRSVLRVLECNLEDVDATAWSLHRSTNTWWKCSHSSIGRDFSWSTSCIRLWCFPKSGSLPGSGQDLAGHRAGAMKSGDSQVNSYTGTRALWAGAFSCLKVKKPASVFKY